MRSRKRAFGAAAAGVFVLGALAGCAGGSGGSGGSGSDTEPEDDFAAGTVEEIQKAAIEDMKALDSVTLAGSLSQGGEELSIDLLLNKEGECSGTLSQQGGTAEFIGVAEASYLKGDEQFWINTTGSKQGAQQVLDLLGDKFAQLPPDEAGFATLCDLDELLSELEDEEEGDSEKGSESEVDGQPAIEIDSKDDDGGTTTGWVAIEDPHYILKVEKTGGEEPGEFTFSGFNEPVEIEEPGADEVVDLSQQAG